MSNQDYVVPETFDLGITDDFLAEIGRVCAHWGYLEFIVEMAISKFAALNENDPRSKMLTAHMTWPQKIDILSSLVHYLIESYPHLTKYKTEILPLLSAAQKGRNKIIHAFWGSKDGKVHMMRATARGELKLSQETASLQDIKRISADVSKAGAHLLALVINKPHGNP